MSPDCLLGVVPQPTESRLSETILELEFGRTMILEILKVGRQAFITYKKLPFTYMDRKLSVDWRTRCDNVQRNDKAFFYKCHGGLFVNSLVMITVKSCLNCRSM